MLVDNVLALGGALEKLSHILADVTSSGLLAAQAQVEALDIMQRALEDFHASAVLIQQRQAAREGHRSQAV